jgi:tRNA (mo5U34)-methyltransferase
MASSRSRHERRGASRGVALDSYVWQGRVPGYSKAGFELARRALGSQVEDREIDVLDVTPSALGSFDFVFFLGVLYHMRHPLLALEVVHGVTLDTAVIETAVDLMDVPWPSMRFYPGAELGQDATNWWGPNPAAVEAMLKSVGFRDVTVKTLIQTTPQQGRLVVHARR